MRKLRIAACAAAAMLAGGAQAWDGAFPPTLTMESSEGADSVKGEVTALLDHPFAIANAQLRRPLQWCEILILHLNVKYCRASGEGPAAMLRVAIGRIHEQPVEDAYAVDFAYAVAADTPELLRVTLGAASGPLGTHDYRIVLEAAPQGTKTLIHLAYSYSYGLAARTAMQVYLATAGRNKVGFTVVGADGGGAPRYIGGMRGVTERNTMRYYLAIEAFLGALSSPASARMEKRLHDWFAAIERYPRQLHEMEEGDYLVMKRAELARQRTGAS